MHFRLFLRLLQRNKGTQVVYFSTNELKGIEREREREKKILIKRRLDDQRRFLKT